MKRNFVISRLGFCGYVHEGMGRNSNYNRGNYAIVVNVSAESKTYHFIGGQSIVVEPNSVLFLPLGSSYVTKTFPTGPFYLLEFMIEGNPEFTPFAFTPRNPAKILADCATAVKLHKRKNIAYQMQIMSKLYNIIADIQIEYNIKYISKDAGAIIMPAIEYIHSNYTKKQFDIGSLAKMCKISEDYFRKIFKSTYNRSPRKYINQLKTSYAADLIKSGMHTITDVCYLAGFENTSYFSREFKKRYNVSPMEYKREYERTFHGLL